MFQIPFDEMEELKCFKTLFIDTNETTDKKFQYPFENSVLTRKNKLKCC